VTRAKRAGFAAALFFASGFYLLERWLLTGVRIQGNGHIGASDISLK
jgi:hypothetical protein